MRQNLLNSDPLVRAPQYRHRLHTQWYYPSLNGSGEAFLPLRRLADIRTALGALLSFLAVIDCHLTVATAKLWSVGVGVPGGTPPGSPNVRPRIYYVNLRQ